ncbi:MAG: 8-oxo-dGTP diphosphatase MutT [Coxiellaceae bacterium]|nr:8-oxo-dGTP diphosphatase MutT [Coxiellaceae bacterium]
MKNAGKKQCLSVIVGVAQNSNKMILLSKRRPEVDHGSLWEFPGGKIEENETPYDALCRELKEEVGIDVVSATPLMQVTHSYPKYDVLLDVWLVDEFSGNPEGLEGQVVCWVDRQTLPSYPMPEANQAIISKLCATAI